MAGEAELLKQLMGMAGTGGLSAASAVNPYAAAANAIPQLIQGGIGVAQAIKGAKLAKSTTRPWMNVPAAQTEALFNARNMATGQAPGLNTAMQQLAQSQAGSISGIQNSGGGGAERLAALTMLDQNAGDQALNLGAMQENWQAQQAMNLQNQLMQMAETQQKQFMYNKDEPYRNIMQASKEQTDAGIQNIHGAATGLGGTFASAITKGAKADVNALVDPAANPSVNGRQMEPSVNTLNQQIDLDNMGPQGEGPMNGMESPYSPSKTPILTPGADDAIQTDLSDRALTAEKVKAKYDMLDKDPISGKQMGSIFPNNNPSLEYANVQLPMGMTKNGKIGQALGSSANPKLLGGQAVFNNLMKQLGLM
jgi:hypothetical protein